MVEGAARAHVSGVLSAFPGARAERGPGDTTVVRVPIGAPPGSEHVVLELGPAFPREPPTVRAEPAVDHPWVHPATGHVAITPQIGMWPYNPDLRAVARELVEALRAAPQRGAPRAAGPAAAQPPVAGFAGLGLGAVPTPPPVRVGGLGAGGGGAGTAGGARRDSGAGGASPLAREAAERVRTAVPDAFRDVDTLGVDELAELLRDAAKLDALAARQARDLGGLVAAVRQENVDIAQQNIQKAERLAQLKSHLAIIRSSDLAPILADYEARVRRQDAVLRRADPVVLAEKLAAKAREADAASERLYDALLDGSLAPDKFCEQYCTERDRFHRLEITRANAPRG